MQKTAICKRSVMPALSPGKRYRLTAQMLRIMRMMVLFLFVTCLHVSARSLSQTVSFTGKNAPLKEVFAAIKAQTGFGVFYNQGLLLHTRPVSLTVTQMPLADFLALALKDQALSYRIAGKTITLSEKKAADKALEEWEAQLVAAPPVKITGVITNTAGQPLNGAIIKIKGRNASAVSNETGNFELMVEAGSTLVISYVGFEEKEVKILAAGTWRIELSPLQNEMDSVVILSTGYQRISRERSAGAFSQPDMTVFNARSTSMNILQRLDGLVPGMVINNSPTATTNPVLVRGLTSVNGTRTPLYVVDGVAVNDLGTINPNDVASITVLKDATAASIWGSRASNGVIVVTTKKGGGKLKVEYDGFYNFQGKPQVDYFPVLSSRQYIDVAKAVFNPTLYPYNSVNSTTAGASVTGLPPHERILYDQSRGLITQDQANQQLEALAAVNNVDQMKDLVYRNAALMNHTLSLSGGSKNYAAYGSFSYTGTQNTGPGNTDNRYKVNLRQDLTINKFLSVYLITDLTNTVSKSKNNSTPDNRFIPYALFADEQQNPLSLAWLYNSTAQRAQYESASGISLEYKPLVERDYALQRINNFLGRVNGGVNVKLMDGLSFQGVYGFVKGNEKNTFYEDERNYNVRSEVVNFTVPATGVGAKPTYYLPNTGARYSVNNTNQSNWTVRNQLLFDKAWNGRKHQLNVLAGQEAQQLVQNSVRSRVYGYDQQLLTFASLDYKAMGTGITGVVKQNNLGYSSLVNQSYTETETEQRFTSYYANAGYTYQGKYTVNGSWRIDQSNLFGKDKSAQNKPIWSTGLAWMISEENFMQSAHWINKLSLRATYGITGNAPMPGTAASYDILSSFNTPIFPGGQSLSVRIPANGKLTWETTATTNIGIDFSVLHNRLGGSIDLYRKNTSNLIGQTTVNLLSGYTSIAGNFGDMYNKGIELSLHSLNVKAGRFAWHSLLNLSYNTNKITRLVLPAPITDAVTLLRNAYVQDYASFAVFAFRYKGLNAAGKPQIALADEKITDARNAAKPADLVYKGSTQPVWNGGFSNSFEYGNFALSVNMVYSLGHVMRRDVNTFFSGRFIGNVNAPLNSGNIHEEFVDRWQNPGDENKTDIPAYIASTSSSRSLRDIQYYTEADLNVLSASFVKVRDLVLQYSIPVRFTQQLKINGITLRAGISNIMVWKNNKYDIDPEFQNSLPQTDANSLLIGGSRTMPRNQHTYTVGLHVNF